MKEILMNNSRVSRERQSILDEVALSNFRIVEGVTEEVSHFMALSGLNGDDNFTLLDVGGGVGHFATELSRNFPKATFTIWDIDEKALNIASEKFDCRLASILDDHIVNTSSKFDVVSMNLMLHHIVGPDS